MYRLLIADDEMIERKVLFKTLSQNLKGQCEIFQAENGREALEIYEKEKIQNLMEEEQQKRKEKLEREKKLQHAALDIKKKFGKNALLKGMNLEEGATAVERNSQIGGHKA